MPRHHLDHLLAATQTAIATYTYAIDDARLHDAPITTVATHAAALGRTLARLEVLAVTHPALTAGADLPAGAVADTEWEAWAAEGRVLDQLVAIPPVPTTVRLRTLLRTGDDALDRVLDALDGAVLPVAATYDGQLVDLDELLPAPDDDVHTAHTFPDGDRPTARRSR